MNKDLLNKDSQIGFEHELANTLFGTAPGPERVNEEDELLQRALVLVRNVAVGELYRISPNLDRLVVKRLSGSNRLAFVRALEERNAKAAMNNMETVREMRKRLDTAFELAQVLSPSAIERMYKGLEELYRQEQEEMRKQSEVDPRSLVEDDPEDLVGGLDAGSASAASH